MDISFPEDFFGAHQADPWRVGCSGLVDEMVAVRLRKSMGRPRKIAGKNV
jgi:hypothetical protein